LKRDLEEEKLLVWFQDPLMGGLREKGLQALNVKINK
jgi:hypothetical protein